MRTAPLAFARRLATRIGPLGLVACLALTSAFASDEPPALSELEHRVFTPRDGAPSGVVALAQSSDGYLWIGTATGLFTYDGVRFRSFGPPLSAALPDADITALEAPRTGGIWVGTRFGKVYFIHDGQVRQYSAAQGLVGDHTIMGLAVDGGGTVWAGTTFGVARLEGEHWVAVPGADGRPIELSGVGSLLADSAGQVWAWTAEGILRHPPGGPAFVPGRRFRSVSGLFADEAGVAWADTVDGTWALDGSGQGIDAATREHPLRKSDPSVGIGLLDRQGGAWGEASGRYFRVPQAWLRHPGATETPTAEMLAPGERQSDTNSQFISWLEDREGNIWVGTDGGLDQFRATKFRHLMTDGSSTGNGAIARGHDGTLWIMNVSGLKHVRDGTTIERMPAASLENQFYTHLSIGRDGSLYVGSIAKLTHWRPEGSELIELPDAPPNMAMQACAEDDQGHLWISATRIGVFRRDNGRWVHKGGFDFLPDRPAMSLTADTPGRIWLGYQDNQLALVDHQHAQLFGAAQGLAVGNVLVVLPTESGAWIGGTRGAAWFDGQRFNALQLERGAPLAGISGAVLSGQGDLWLNGVGGVTRIAADELARFRRDPGRVVASETFGAESGIEGAPPNLRPVPTATATADGRLWFETVNGVYWISPAHMARNTVVPHVEVLDVVAGDRHFGPRPAALPELTQSLRFDFTATDLTLSQRVHFRYRLQGVDTDWQEAEGRRQAFYTKLPPGRYDFRVIAANEDGLWNESGASVSITIPPAWWQTTWFRALSGLAVLVLLWALYSLRMRALAKRERTRFEDRLRERERIARELHDTLLQGTQGLVLNLQVVAGEMPQGDTRRGRLESLLDEADSVLAQARDRVHDLRDLRADESDLVASLSALGTDLAHGTNIRFSMRVGTALPALAPDIGTEAFFIAREALTNAFRHARARTIEVEIECVGRTLRVAVNDDGRGIDPQVIADGGRPGHWGMTGMRERAARIQARLDVRGRVHDGTQLLLEIPLRVTLAQRAKECILRVRSRMLTLLERGLLPRAPSEP